MKVHNADQNHEQRVNNIPGKRVAHCWVVSIMNLPDVAVNVIRSMALC